MTQVTLAHKNTAVPQGAISRFGIDLVAGTPVMTLHGILPAEHLLPDDRIITRTGAMRVLAVTSRTARNPVLMRVSAAALADDHPEEDVLLPADQPIRLRDWRAKAMFGTEQATVAVHRLADGIHICAEHPASIRLVHIDLPRDAVIYAGGLELEAQPVTARTSVTA